jgi:hypothetical protein
MKALKTVVATAVIVFALTTVALAGAQRLNGPDGAATAGPAGAAQPAAAQPALQGSVTLSAQQFAALLHAVDGDRDRDRDRTHARDKARAHTQSKARSHTHARKHSQTHAADGDASGAVSTTSHRTTTRHSAAQHTVVHTSTRDGGGHDSGDGGGGHSGGEGGCD